MCKSVSRLRIRFILKSARFRGYVVNERQYISIGSIFQRFKIRLNIAVKQACFNHKEGIKCFSSNLFYTVYFIPVERHLYKGSLIGILLLLDLG